MIYRSIKKFVHRLRRVLIFWKFCISGKNVFYATLARHTGITFGDTEVVLGWIVVLGALNNCSFARRRPYKTRGDISVWKVSQFSDTPTRLGGTFGVPYQLNRKWIEKTQGHVERFRWPHCRIPKNLWQKSCPGPRVGAPTWYLCQKVENSSRPKKVKISKSKRKNFFFTGRNFRLRNRVRP